METYKDFAPTVVDRHITIEGHDGESREDWLLPNVGRTRDSVALANSNFECMLRDLGGEGDNVEVHRFGHWGPGWFEIILVRPDTSEAELAEEMSDALEGYPILDEEHFSQLETEEADETWRECYDWKERVEYVRKHPDDFDFGDFAGLMGCIRGEYFGGCAGDLLGG